MLRLVCCLNEYGIGQGKIVPPKLALDQRRRHPKPDKNFMAHVVFVCPETDRNVHHWLDADDEKGPPSEDKYDACPACAKLHFVNRKTGKLLGYEK